MSFWKLHGHEPNLASLTNPPVGRPVHVRGLTLLGHTSQGPFGNGIAIAIAGTVAVA